MCMSGCGVYFHTILLCLCVEQQTVLTSKTSAVSGDVTLSAFGIKNPLDWGLKPSDQLFIPHLSFPPSRFALLSPLNLFFAQLFSPASLCIYTRQELDMRYQTCSKNLHTHGSDFCRFLSSPQTLIYFLFPWAVKALTHTHKPSTHSNISSYCGSLDIIQKLYTLFCAYSSVFNR